MGAYNHFEAQAPIALEAAIAPDCDETLPFEIFPSAMPATAVLSRACPGDTDKDMAAKDAAMAPTNVPYRRLFLGSSLSVEYDLANGLS